MSETMRYRTFQEHERDVRFAEQAAAFGMAEVEMSELALKQSSSESVREYARHVLEEHRQADKELATYAMKHQIDLRPKITSDQKSSLERLSALSGSEFDRAYIADQVQMHQKAVDLWEDEIAYGQNGDLKMWASKTLPTLRSHLHQARIIAEGRAPTPASR
jgi:putative membrane protein